MIESTTVSKSVTLNVLGTELLSCSHDPVTGYFRDGCCNTDEHDHGSHVVCAIMTQEFLQFSKEHGNNLITPRSEWNFPGLVPGDQWCLCAIRWKQAYDQGVAPKVILESTHHNALQYATLDQLSGDRK
jgi:uncharacterized protein (DUF2237 family)